MLRSGWSRLACLLHDLQTLLVVFELFLELAHLSKRVPNICVRRALARFVACKNENFNGSEMLRSDWSIQTCQLRDLQTFLVILDRLVELAQ